MTLEKYESSEQFSFKRLEMWKIREIANLKILIIWKTE